MIIRKTPDNLEDYILINDTDTAIKLQSNNFCPLYMDNNGLYFAKESKLELVLNQIKAVN